MEATSKQLEDLQNYGNNSDDEVRNLRAEKAKLENDKRKLQVGKNSFGSVFVIFLRPIGHFCGRYQLFLI